MSQVYIVADLKLKENEARDQEIIRNWNRVVQNDDLVLLFGVITKSKEIASIKKIFDQLNGNKRVMDINYHNIDEVNKIEYITGNFPYQMNCFVSGVIRGEKQDVILPMNKGLLYSYKKKKYYCAGPTSLLRQNDIFENNCLDISIEKWGDIPILYTDIPVLINNMLSFEEEFNNV